MTLRLLIDMNLSPDWVDALRAQGWYARHWSTVGMANAADSEIMTWARTNGHIVFTHDLDFGSLLALTHGLGPSVIQVRGTDVMPDKMALIVVAALKQHGAELAAGALVVVDGVRSRVRLLPI